MTEYKRGDRVKVTIEGTVERVDTVRTGTVTELKIRTEDDTSRPFQFVYDIEGVDIEVLAPPARPFQVGDRVRSTFGNNTEWIVGREGYLVVKCSFSQAVGEFHEYDGALEDNFPTGSDLYELVEAAQS